MVDRMRGIWDSEIDTLTENQTERTKGNVLEEEVVDVEERKKKKAEFQECQSDSRKERGKNRLTRFYKQIVQSAFSTYT